VTTAKELSLVGAGTGVLTSAPLAEIGVNAQSKVKVITARTDGFPHLCIIAPPPFALATCITVLPHAGSSSPKRLAEGVGEVSRMPKEWGSWLNQIPLSP